MRSFLFVAFAATLPALAGTIDFTNLGTFSATTVSSGGITVSGSADVNVLQLNGLGIVGGANSNTVDGTEYIEFLFTGGLALNVSYFVPAAGNLDADGFVGERFLEAFDMFGSSLGVVNQNGSGGYQVSSLFAGEALSRFRLTADVDSFRVSSVTFDSVPEPASLFLLGSGLLATMVRRRFVATRSRAVSTTRTPRWSR